MEELERIGEEKENHNHNIFCEKKIFSIKIKNKNKF